MAAIDVDASPLAGGSRHSSLLAPKLRGLRRAIRREPIGAIAGLVLVLVFLGCLFGEAISGYGAKDLDTLARFEAPGAKHWFGTDNLGRDIFAQIAYGGRSTLWVAFVSIGLAAVAGMVLGLVAAYYGGIIDTVLSRLIDALLAMPSLLLAMILVLSLGAGERAIILAIAAVETPRVARVMRATVIGVRSEVYILAAQSIGASDRRIMLRHLMPQTFNTIFVVASSALGIAILIDASLSFLGVGRPPTEPTWGGMVAGPGRIYLESSPWIALFPGLAIGVVVLSFNLLGDSLRVLLDPKGRER